MSSLYRPMKLKAVCSHWLWLLLRCFAAENVIVEYFFVWVPKSVNAQPDSDDGGVTHPQTINKPAHLCLPPPSSLSLCQPSPPLSPHQWRLPLRGASLLRGFLCSLVSQVNTCMGRRREGGSSLKKTHHFLCFKASSEPRSSKYRPRVNADGDFNDFRANAGTFWLIFDLRRRTGWFIVCEIVQY